LTDYRSSGVDIEAGDAVKARIADLVKSTYSEQVLTRGGEFAGLVQLPDYHDALAVSIDGVGTKLKVAVLSNIHNTVGQDLVNHCVNDIAVMGCDPLCFVDYMALGKLDEQVVLQIIEGLCAGCKENGIALIGGETAQMPDMYAEGEYDLAGAIVGLVNPEKRFPKSNIAAGDLLLGVASTGLHTNGYSLARKIVFEEKHFTVDTYDDLLGCTWGEELLKIHRSYRNLIKSLITIPGVKAFSHITGGGIPGNLSRILPKSFNAIIETNKIRINPVFSALIEYGNIDREEAYNVFNMGIGLIAVVASHNIENIKECANQYELSYDIGYIEQVNGTGDVILQ